MFGTDRPTEKDPETTHGGGTASGVAEPPPPAARAVPPLAFPPAVHPRRAPRAAPMEDREYAALNRQRAVRCLLVPYLRSRVRPHEFRPLLAYLFTEWKCNLDCHY